MVKEDKVECSAGSYLARSRQGVKFTIVKLDFVVTAQYPIGYNIWLKQFN